MKNATKTLKAIKNALGMTNLASMKLEDGVTVIEADAFEIGKSVVIVTEDDQRIALPIGEYVLEDGTMIRVEEEGIIAFYGNAEDVVEEEVVEEEVEASTNAGTSRNPKKVVTTKEQYFNEEVVETIETVEEEVLTEVAAVINELTPEEITVEDSEALAVIVVDVLTETLDEVGEEVVEAFMRKKKKYGKNKLSEEEAAVIEESETAIVEVLQEVINAETPDVITAEISTEIAEVIAEVVQEIVAEAPVEMKTNLFKVARLSKRKIANLKRMKAKAKVKNSAKPNKAKLKKQTKLNHVKPIKHNPESNSTKGFSIEGDSLVSFLNSRVKNKRK
tara:strand:- start:462 stop:1460 length:999 start_codon:yes stop_codon:yes gene_type:complete